VPCHMSLETIFESKNSGRAPSSLLACSGSGCWPCAAWGPQSAYFRTWDCHVQSTFTKTLWKHHFKTLGCPGHAGHWPLSAKTQLEWIQCFATAPVAVQWEGAWTQAPNGHSWQYGCATTGIPCHVSLRTDAARRLLLRFFSPKRSL